MKKLFTKAHYFIVVTMLILGTTMSASAQFTVNTVGTNVRSTAVTKDASGNVYVIEDPTDVDAGEIIRIKPDGTTKTIFNSNTALADDNGGSTDNYAFGIVVDSNGNLFVSTSSDFNNSFYGNILKLTYNSGADTYTYSGTPFITGNANVGEFESMAIDASNNLYVVQYDVNGNGGASTNGIPGAYEVAEYASGSTSFTRLYSKLELAEFNSGDQYSGISGLALDPTTGDVYVADSFDLSDASADGGHVYKLKKSTGYTASTFLTNQFTTALAADASGDIYACNGSATSNTYSLVEYTFNPTVTTTTLYSGLSTDGNWYPTGIAVSSSTSIYAVDGGEETGTDNQGNFLQLIGPPTTQASGVAFNSTTEKATTISWTNGGGADRAVFVAAATSGNISLANSTPYTPNTIFSDGTQAGTGWYCVYNGSGTSVPVTGLTAATGYKVMVVEFNGPAGAQNYLTGATVNTFTTAATPALTASTGSDSYSVGGTATVVDAGITATAGQANLSSATVAVSTSFTSGDVLNFTNQNGITGSYSSGTLTLSGSTTVANYQAALRSITFSSTASSSAMRTISFSVNDGTSGSNTVTKNINVSVATTLSSIALVNASVNNLSTVQYTVTFAAAVSNLGTGNFTATATSGSISGQSVTGVSGSNPYTVTVNTGSGDGTLRLDLTSASGLSPGVSNAPYTSGPSYTIDKTPPTATISAPSVTYANSSAAISYTVTFTDANMKTSSLSNFGALTVFENSTTTGSATINSISTGGTYTQSGNNYSFPVTFNDMTGDGTLSFRVPAGTVSDNAGNTSTASSPSATVIIDNTPPVVTISAPSVSSTQSGPVSYTATWSDTNLNAASIALAAVQVGINVTGTANYGSIAVTGSGNTRTITIGSITGAGTLGIFIPSGTASDLAGNTAGAAGPSTTFDVVQPTTISSLSAASGTTTNAGTVQYTATFAAAEGNVSASNFSLNTTGGVSGASITGVSGSGATWTVTVNTGSGDGTIQLQLANSTGMSLPVSNTPFNGDTYTIDKTAPTVTISAPSVTYANSSAAISYTVTFTDANMKTSSLSNFGAFSVFENSTVTGSATINSISVGTYTQSGNNYSFPVTFNDMTGDGTLSFTVPAGTVSDNAGNTSTASSPSATVIIDNTPPSATISAPSVAAIGNNGAGSVSYTITYADANFNSSNLTNAGITLNTTGTANGTYNVSGSGTSYTVTVSNIGGAGTLGITLAGGYASDLAGNIDGGAGPSATFNVIAPPVSVNDSYIVNAGSVLTINAASGVLANDTDPNGLPLTAILVAGTANGALTLNSDGSFVYTPNANFFGSDSFTYQANNGVLSGNTATVSITVSPSTDATLSGLAINTGTLTPGFTSGNTTYTASVPATVNSITVTPTTNNANATVTVNGGPASSAQPLNVGDNTITTVVTAQDGTTTDTYTLTVTRAAGNALLSSIKNNTNSTLTERSNIGNTVNYTLGVDAGTSSITLTPTAIDPNATILVNGTAVPSGTASGAIALNSSGTTLITTVVTAIDGVTTENYNITVNLNGSTNAMLSSLTLNPPSVLIPATGGANTVNYTTSVDPSVTSLAVTPTAEDPGATITVNGNPATSGSPATVTLSGALTTITTVVTAPDGITKETYTIAVSNTGSNNALLSSLRNSTVSRLIHTGVTGNTVSYTLGVDPGISSITLTPTAEDPNAAILVNGTAVASGTASGAITLNSGGTTLISTVVTAVDGVTTENYNITVNQNGSNNALLSSLTLNSGSVLVQGAGSANTINYTTGVNPSTTSVAVTPTADDPNSVITINGSPATSGSPSTVTLTEAQTTITTVVTAPDGVTTETYTIVVSNTGSNNALLSSIRNNTNSTLNDRTATGNTVSYNLGVDPAVSSIVLTPTAVDPNAVILVNGTAVSSGTATGAITLNSGATTLISIIVTAEDGVTTENYNITVNRNGSDNALLSSIRLPGVSLINTGISSIDTVSYTATVSNATSNVKVIPTTVDPAAVIQVNSATVASGTASAAIPLNVGANTITTIVTAPDGVTTETYIVTVTRQSLPSDNSAYQAVSVVSPTDSIGIADDGIVVHHGVSPNGDGINDVFTIDGLQQYPDNRVAIINSSGGLVFETTGYDNVSRAFDGHSNKNGALQLPGTYFYALDYKVNGVSRRKTGYIILKY